MGERFTYGRQLDELRAAMPWLEPAVARATGVRSSGDAAAEPGLLEADLLLLGALAGRRPRQAYVASNGKTVVPALPAKAETFVAGRRRRGLGLTRTHRRILRLYLAGLTKPEIARLLSVSQSAVSVREREARRLLGVRLPWQAALTAYLTGQLDEAP